MKQFYSTLSTYLCTYDHPVLYGNSEFYSDRSSTKFQSAFAVKFPFFPIIRRLKLYLPALSNSRNHRA